MKPELILMWYLFVAFMFGMSHSIYQETRPGGLGFVAGCALGTLTGCLAGFLSLIPVFFGSLVYKTVT